MQTSKLTWTTEVTRTFCARNFVIMGDNGDVNANQNCHATGDPQLDKAIYQWINWDRVSSGAIPSILTTMYIAQKMSERENESIVVVV